MSRHSFDPEIAAQVGINAAVIYQNLVFWCEKNAANGRNIHEGNAWTYNSKKAFAGLFPYLSERQIRTALQKLEEENLVLVGCFNKEARDRTKWYAVHDITVTLHLSEKSNGTDFEVQALPDGKPDGKQDTPYPKGGDLFSEDENPENPSDTFDVFWKAYPKKAGKPAARKAWDKAIKRSNPSEIIEGAKRYAAWLSEAKPGEFRPHAKFPQGWLNDGRWNDEEIWQGAGAGPSWDSLTESQRRMLERRQCPPSMLGPDGKPNEIARALMAQVAG